MSDARVIERSVMVIGEGEDGRRATSALEDAGYAVIAVLHSVREGDGSSPNGTRVARVDGCVGRFVVRLDDAVEDSARVGAIVVALGNQRVRVEVACPQHSLLSIWTPLEWAAQVRQDLQTEYRVAWAKRRVMVLLDYPEDTPKETGAEALRAVQEVMAWAHPETYVYYRNLQVDTYNLERLTRITRDMGVVYCRYDHLDVSFADDQVIVDTEEGQRIGDLLVIPERIAPPAAALDLADRLGIGLGDDGLFQDVNMRFVDTVQTVRRGVYVVGRCHLDADEETQAADLDRLVGEIDALLGAEGIPWPDEYAEVTSDECIRCLTCIRTCPHQAVELRTTEEVTAAHVVPEACWGCGMCVANCPVRAISLATAEGLVEQEAV